MTLEEAKDIATKEVFHMKFEKAFLNIILGKTNFTMSEVESVIDKAAELYASEREKQHLEKIAELESLIYKSRDAFKTIAEIYSLYATRSIAKVGIDEINKALNPPKP